MLLTLVFFSCFTFSQSDSLEKEKSVSGVELFPASNGAKKWKILLGLDARRSFFSGVPVKLNGIKLGAEYKGVHRFGFGFYWLKRNVIFTDIDVNKTDAAVDSEVRFDLGYSSIFYERVFLKTRWWEIAFPFHLGGGQIKGSYKDTLGAFKPFLDRPFSALTGATQVKFYPFSWLALKILGGYRLTFNTHQEVRRAFNQPFYGFGLCINIIELYHIICKKPANDHSRN